jgi:hypothetical protein
MYVIIAGSHVEGRDSIVLGLVYLGSIRD